MDMIEKIELFRQNRLPYIHRHILNPPNNHHSIIGQWERWWNEDTNIYNANRGVFDESITCDGRRADMMFLEESSNSFEIKGVAEIENSNNIIDILEKLDTLEKYDNSPKKFPDLEFVILCNAITVEDNKYNYLLNLLKEARNKSKNSDLFWIIYILKIFNNPEHNMKFNIPGDSSECLEYKNQGSYAILQFGKDIKIENYI